MENCFLHIRYIYQETVHVFFPTICLMFSVPKMHITRLNLGKHGQRPATGPAIIKQFKTTNIEIQDKCILFLGKTSYFRLNSR